MTTLPDVLRNADFDALLAFAREKHLIHGYREAGEAVLVTYGGESIHLSRTHAQQYVRGLVRAHAIGAGEVPRLKRP